MANHTPGPWHKWSGVHPDGRHYWVIGPGDGFPAIGIANVEQLPATRSGEPCNRLELHYNAALVSAAPELLSALKLLRNPSGDGNWSCDCDDPHYVGTKCENCIATAAINKAEGSEN